MKSCYVHASTSTRVRFHCGKYAATSLRTSRAESASEMTIRWRRSRRARRPLLASRESCKNERVLYIFPLFLLDTNLFLCEKLLKTLSMGKNRPCKIVLESVVCFFVDRLDSHQECAEELCVSVVTAAFFVRFRSEVGGHHDEVDGVPGRSDLGGVGEKAKYIETRTIVDMKDYKLTNFCCTCFLPRSLLSCGPGRGGRCRPRRRRRRRRRRSGGTASLGWHCRCSCRSF